MANDKPSWTPKCPNHHCALEGVGFPLPKKGTGRCPVSGVPFSFEVDQSEDVMAGGVKKDKNGNIIKGAQWKVTGDEPNSGTVY